MNRDGTRQRDGGEHRCAAVVSDGSALGDHAAGPVGPIVHEFAEHLGGLARVTVRPVTVDAADAAELAAGIRALRAEVGPILLTHTDPERTRLVQQDLRDGGMPLVLTDQDATAIALTTAVLVAVADRPPASRIGKVVVAGAQYLPILAPLLAAAGVADITTWNTSDAVTFPLRHVASGAGAVVDLIGALPGWGDEDRHAELAVITRGAARTAPCAVAGLLRAALRDPATTFDLATYLAAARALITAHAVDLPLTQRNAQVLTDRVTDAVRSPIHARQVTTIARAAKEATG
ncbi:hypothetical protein QRX60_44045 [Amycolatopsis mongoliensis]|uniref:Uncharacterized protein n=1 Tax=Amycolatopsis mongoliensis TaxID=715475 RepID=A0A9Y2NIN7_9PSEU|nr:hypothetical protein [Amycolatopsis sp. 4-36]WIY00948.1 hypothetical protein QRX60_44045 [Amycolatopsis sp. 4-36]